MCFRRIYIILNPEERQMSHSNTNEDSASANLLKWILITWEKFKCSFLWVLWCAISYSRKRRPDTNTEDLLTCSVVLFFS